MHSYFFFKERHAALSDLSCFTEMKCVILYSALLLVILLGSGHTLVAPDEHTKRQWIITIGKTLEKLDRTDLPSTPTPTPVTPVIVKVI